MGRIIMLPIDDSEYSLKAWQFYKDAIRSPCDDLLILHCVEFPYIPQYG
ncbi:hypothetical protein LSH36_965g00014 [Paralvinella palmiformis]|uniref:Universal stress protein n=1 Tax=Paralvinella palmiformis TaxID=53620 RepID=A0AAD9IXF8_9ANNE|nr:hypothetical protein LSH36_965g00014 [Paralvinella palmiformis]